ncbi:hypothetical protein VPHD479_0053 [Vibrio phage D479]
MILTLIYVVLGLMLYVAFRERMMNHEEIVAFRKENPKCTDKHVEVCTLFTLVLLGPVLATIATIAVLFKKAMA